MDSNTSWILSNKITTYWNSPLQLYKQNRKENSYPKSLFVPLSFSLYLSYFCFYIYSLVMLMTLEFLDYYRVAFGSIYWLLHSVTIKGDGNILFCFIKFTLMRFAI